MRAINDRVKFVIEEQFPERGRFTELEAQSGIAAESWKKFWYGNQKVSLAMLEFMFHNWPEYAFYVATGITDSAHGHIGPEQATWEQPFNRKRSPQDQAKQFFQTKLLIRDRVLSESRKELLSEEKLELGLQDKRRMKDCVAAWEEDAARGFYGLVSPQDETSFVNWRTFIAEMEQKQRGNKKK